ncbi:MULTISPECIES: GNAT family N-acetyltransferase [unclassified Rhizobium]|uniref:GNAT family N-acetyltransferase n=1 Tax=unclassified Rhizobium TaxID=2613769 RepID=UPI001ADC02F1|nr:MULTISPECIES: GNAT family N-acetyltransferase [unclassified Rhizobium]MBO9097889.1 GNAT family N-acetyltransferase [Rhizobium sp. L58/93]MBO9133328.1 GNAT family N-acetyltransferase [Rhizobium sp. B209b/85]MBO9168040.1 GNAT family N-acetyltransferase [Rhizobium sp. L245/93]MBO9184085.1 GNAT family N-acetyltransferase [Rhizobium sp. E27B/91]QXZ84303.1 GNAT family N-acetyltransferase [Rhizobium sp. K1/93]
MLWLEAWGCCELNDFSRILSRRPAGIVAYADGQLVGFVNVAWDGGVHAFILDTCVDPRMRRQGIATGRIKEATSIAQEHGARWLRVNVEPQLASLYRSCDFWPTEAGLIELQ